MLVVHDWGSALGFEWARHNAKRVAGIVYMEAMVTPLTWADWPENARRAFQGFRSDKGEEMILTNNMFVERVLPGSIMRKLGDDEMAAYRKPFANAGEDRRPTLTWPRMIPIEGEPADVTKIVEDYSAWLATVGCAEAVHQCRARLDPHRPSTRSLPPLAEPDGNHRQGPALHAGGQPRRDRRSGRRFRAAGTLARTRRWL